MDGDPGFVLVGSDGSWRSAAVLDVAAQEASSREVPLAVVSVVREVADARFSLTALLTDERRAADLADWRLREAVSRIRARHPALEVTTHRLGDRDLGWPDERTLPLAGAGLLVVGARGRHSEPAFSLGTVSRHLLKVTSCPVLVVPDRVPETGARPGSTSPPVVAGVDGGPLSVPVLRAALDEAVLQGSSVVAVHTFRVAPDQDPDLARAQARARVERLVMEARLSPDVPADVRVRVVLTQDPPAEALVLVARSGSRLVLSTRGPAALAGLAIESVSRTVLDAMPCPVLLLVPRTARGLPDDHLPRQRHTSAQG